jgi:hypothetical protein
VPHRPTPRSATGLSTERTTSSCAMEATRLVSNPTQRVVEPWQGPRPCGQAGPPRCSCAAWVAARVGMLALCSCRLPGWLAAGSGRTWPSSYIQLWRWTRAASDTHRHTRVCWRSRAACECMVVHAGQLVSALCGSSGATTSHVGRGKTRGATRPCAPVVCVERRRSRHAQKAVREAVYAGDEAGQTVVVGLRSKVQQVPFPRAKGRRQSRAIRAARPATRALALPGALSALLDVARRGLRREGAGGGGRHRAAPAARAGARRAAAGLRGAGTRNRASSLAREHCRPAQRTLSCLRRWRGMRASQSLGR